MKRLKKALVVLFLTLVVGLSSAVPAFATATDSTLPTSFISYSTNTTSNVRVKDNDTSVYMKNTSGMTLWVYANGGSKPSSVGVTYSTGTTRNGHANVPAGQWLIINYINENGYGTAWLNISTASSSVSGNLSGLWSPDSVGSYPIAN
jgi:hypothetical protein